MKITRVESLHADGGWRSLDFLKISTDEGIVGWSEYNESFGGVGVSAAIAGLAPALIGRTPARGRPTSRRSPRSADRPPAG